MGADGSASKLDVLGNGSVGKAEQREPGAFLMYCTQSSMKQMTWAKVKHLFSKGFRN